MHWTSRVGSQSLRLNTKNFLSGFPLRPRESGLQRASWAKCDQVTTLEKTLALYPPLGRSSLDVTLSRIEAAIKTALDLD